MSYPLFCKFCNKAMVSIKRINEVYYECPNKKCNYRQVISPKNTSDLEKLTFIHENRSSEKKISDIYISIDRCRENARELKQSFRNELHRLFIHGVLHLLGYKDKSKAEKQEMTAKEDYYLSLRSEYGL